MSMVRPMPTCHDDGKKHRMFVAPYPGFMPSNYVFFQCQYCWWNFNLYREVMNRLLSGRMTWEEVFSGDDRFNR